MYQILKKQKVGEGIYEMQIEVPHIVKNALPGNFMILRIGENGERVPFTIVDHDDTSATIVFRARGKTTVDLSRLKKGNNLKDVVGPLGNPSEIDEYGIVALVAGGMGLTSIYPIAKALREKGNNIICIIGASTASRLFWIDKFEAVSDKLIICTEDGSLGEKSNASQWFERVIRRTSVNRVIAAGPPAMLKEITRLSHQRTKARVHLSSIMMDGIGMCGGCRVRVDGKTRFVCLDGPEFDADAVDYASIKNRSKRFLKAERRLMKHHHGCVDALRAVTPESVSTGKERSRQSVPVSPRVPVVKKPVKKPARKTVNKKIVKKKIVKKVAKKAVKKTGTKKGAKSPLKKNVRKVAGPKKQVAKSSAAKRKSAAKAMKKKKEVKKR